MGFFEATTLRTHGMKNMPWLPAGSKMKNPEAQQSKHQRRVVFRGLTRAYRRFNVVVFRTEGLLKAAELGVSQEVKYRASLLDRFKDFALPRGRTPRDYKPQIHVGDKAADGTIELRMDGRSAGFMKSVVTSSLKEGRELRFHFCAVLFVYTWAAFETYITMLLEELYRRRPELLKSKESLTYEDAITHRDSLVDLLIQKQLIRLGRLSFGDNLKYLRARLGVMLSERQQERLRRYYVLRNVVAHNTGLVAPPLTRSLPARVRVQAGEVRIGRSFLRSMLRHTRHAARTIERQVMRKFYRNGAGSGQRGSASELLSNSAARIPEK